MKTIVHKHPLAVRWFHWINFPVLALMIWSGILIYWANSVYMIGPAHKPLFKFFPQGFYKHFHINHRLAEGMNWHFALMWLVLLHDLHIRKYAPPQIKYNAAQRIAYTAIIVMGLGSLLTGLAIYKPVQFSTITALCGGYAAARAEHFILTIGYVLFFFIHIVQVIKTGWNNFQAMVTGFQVIKPSAKKTSQ
jgi:thiosulfate reductase cytochrome b subunit